MLRKCLGIRSASAPSIRNPALFFLAVKVSFSFEYGNTVEIGAAGVGALKEVLDAFKPQ